MAYVRSHALSALVALTTLALAHPTPARAGDEGVEGGIGIGYIGRLSLQASSADTGPGRDESGALTSAGYESTTPLKLAVDFAALPLPSVNGLRHGFEFSGSVSFLPFDLDVWGGTAFTMFALGKGGLGTLRFRGGFGAGMSMNHAYFYLRSQLAAVIVPNSISAEAGVFWIPNQVSYAWGDYEGDFEEQRRRASVFINLGKDARKFEVYVESVDRQRGGHGEAFSAAREDFTVRDPDDDLRGYGLGGSLMLNF